MCICVFLLLLDVLEGADPRVALLGPVGPADERKGHRMHRELEVPRDRLSRGHVEAHEVDAPLGRPTAAEVVLGLEVPEHLRQGEEAPAPVPRPARFLST